MNFLVAVIVAALAIVEAVTIDHDQVQPFGQPEPVTVSEKTAIRFKPSIVVLGSCHPYPAVNAAGDTSGGLKATGSPSSGCKGSELGSQIYGRARWYSDMWAIMYAWYFPKHAPTFGKGYRHEWQNVVVWIDNPAADPPTIKAISVDNGDWYDIHRTGLEDKRNGSSPNVVYAATSGYSDLGLTVTGPGSKFQDLIM